MQQIKRRRFDAVRLARLEILNSIDEESRDKLRKDKYLQYTRRNEVPKTSQPEPPRKNWTSYSLPYSSTSNKNVNVYLNVNVTNVLAKVMVFVPLSELIEIPSQMEK